MTPEQLALLGDNRLSDGARLIGLWIAVQEADDDGWVELPFDEARSVLHDYPPDSTIRRHLRMLVGSGWAERRPGGRGHGDRFRLDMESRLKNKTRNGVEAKNFRVDMGSSLNTPRSSSTKVGSSTMEKSQAQAREDHGVTERASQAMQRRDDDLNGCRGALQDYLSTYVPPHRQYGYVQTVVTWLDGADRSVFQLPDGGQLPGGERTGYLAAALNELMAGEESKMKRPVGDPGNLKTKLNILLKQRGYDGRSNADHGGSSTGAPRGEAPSGIDRGQGSFRVERGDDPGRRAS